MIKNKQAGVRVPLLICVSACVTGLALVAADWPTQSGSPQRDGWARSEKVLTKESVSGLDLLYKYKADNESKGLYSLTSPVIDGMLITYRGFKEMLVFSGSSDNVYSVDADLNRLIWSTHFEYNGDKKQARKSTAVCPAGLTDSVAMAGSSSAAVSFGRKPAPAATANGAKPAAPIGGSGFGSVGAFFIVSSDGYLHTLNPSTGGDLIPAVKFLPPNSRVSALNVNNNLIYATTTGECGGNPNALYGIDPSSADKKVSTLPIAVGGVSSFAGTAIGNDATVYVQMPFEQGQTAGEYHRTLLALDPDTLSVKDSFTTEDSAAFNKHVEAAGATPLVFPWKGKDLVVASGSDGRLYLLDSTSLGGADHRTPLFKTEPIATVDSRFAGNGFRGGFSSWNDPATGTRWVYASLWGPPQPGVKFALQNGDAATGSILAFKVSEEKGQPTLAPAWISTNIQSPATAVTAGGVVFALATGEPASAANGKGKPLSVEEIEKTSTHAVLYALDGDTGKQLYSSGTAVASPAYGSGIAVANGRIYFGTSDNNMYSFGFAKMQPQLTDK